MQPEWKSISTPALIGAILFTAVILYFANTGARWVPLIDGANLMFHEAGHPFFGLISERLMVYGGTLGQLVFPSVTAIYFWREKQTVSYFFCVIWLMQNLWNISRYMADARIQQLPLIGGGEHDWSEIFIRWNCIQHETRIAGRVSFLAFVGTLTALMWLGKRYRNQSGQAAPVSTHF